MIYKNTILLIPNHPLHRELVHFYREPSVRVIEDKLHDRLQRPRLLAVMDDCRTLLRIENEVLGQGFMKLGVDLLLERTEHLSQILNTILNILRCHLNGGKMFQKGLVDVYLYIFKIRILQDRIVKV